jgi:Protein kinase domain/C2 domain
MAGRKGIQNCADVWDKFGTKCFVYVMEATGLTGSDSTGASADPMLRLYLENTKQKWETKSQKRTVAPHWDEMFALTDPEGTDLKLEVWCSKKKKFLGKANVGAIIDFEEDTIVDRWLELSVRPNKKKDKVSGRVHLRLFVSKKHETRPPKIDYSVYLEHLPHFKAGDLVVLSGIGMLDTLTQITTGFPFSRVGMVIEAPNKWTRMPELYLLECTRNVDGFLDAPTEAVRRNSASVFRLAERLFQLHASSLWWLPLKAPLTETQKFKVNEFAFKVHNEPHLIRQELEIADERIIQFVTATFGEKSFRDPMEFVDLYSAPMCVEILRLAGLVSPPGGSNRAGPHELVNFDCYAKPVLLRPPTGGQRPPSTTNSSTRADGTVSTASSSSSSSSSHAASSSSAAGGGGDDGPATIPQGGAGTSTVLGSQALAGSLTVVGSAAAAMGAAAHTSPASPVGGVLQQHSAGHARSASDGGGALVSRSSSASTSFSVAPTRSIGVSATDRHMALPDFRTCRMDKLDKLGSGAFGAVWRCSLEGYTCAVKIVKIGADTDQYDIDALKLETQILENASHPNIVKYLGHDFRADEMHLFLELMPNSLRDIMKTMRPQDNNPHHIRRIAQEIAKGLHYLHSMDPPIIHRDIKGMLHRRRIAVIASKGRKAKDEKQLDSKY